MININRRLKSAVVFCLVFFSVMVSAADFPAPPNPFRYVNDYTGTLSVGEQNALENKLTAYGRETSSQIAVVMVPTTAEYDISQYAFELGDKWGIGRKQLNNGVLMLIAKNDRRIFIAVGQGLEGVLPDAFLSQTIRNRITPGFKQNQYAQGISDGLDDIIAASKGEYAAAKAEGKTPFEEFIHSIMLALFLLVVVCCKLNRCCRPYISPTNNHGRRGGGFGGFGGRSGGGFGGGSFGGGGAGGSW